MRTLVNYVYTYYYEGEEYNFTIAAYSKQEADVRRLLMGHAKQTRAFDEQPSGETPKPRGSVLADRLGGIRGVCTPEVGQNVA
jgi:hypothetical protein